MTNEEILRKAIRKAHKNGWKGWSFFPFKQYVEQYRLAFMIPKIIFNHDFAKSFWGEEMYYHFIEGKWDEICSKEEVGEEKEWEWWKVSWQHHLQTMVLEPEPLKYLEKFLGEDR